MATKLILYCHKHDKSFTLVSGITLRSFYLHKYLQLLMNNEIEILKPSANLSEEHANFLSAWNEELIDFEKELIIKAIKEKRKIVHANYFFNPFSDGKEIVNLGVLQFVFDKIAYTREYADVKPIEYIERKNKVFIKCPIDQKDFLDLLQKEEVA